MYSLGGSEIFCRMSAAGPQYHSGLYICMVYIEKRGEGIYIHVCYKYEKGSFRASLKASWLKGGSFETVLSIISMKVCNKIYNHFHQ